MEMLKIQTVKLDLNFWTNSFEIMSKCSIRSGRLNVRLLSLKRKRLGFDLLGWIKVVTRHVYIVFICNIALWFAFYYMSINEYLFNWDWLNKRYKKNHKNKSVAVIDIFMKIQHFSIGHNLLPVREEAYIFGICILLTGFFYWLI